jgi:hypothetical protein
VFDVGGRYYVVISTGYRAKQGMTHNQTRNILSLRREGELTQAVMTEHTAPTELKHERTNHYK